MRRQRSKRFTKHIVSVGDKANLPAQSPTSPRLSISDIAESTKISPPEKKRRIKEQGDVFAKRCVIFCWQVTDKDVSSFLNQWKLNDSYIVYIHKQRALSSQFRILLVKAFVPERCVIFCWQVMNMFYLFLTNGSKTTLILFIYTNNAR